MMSVALPAQPVVDTDIISTEIESVDSSFEIKNVEVDHKRTERKRRRNRRTRRGRTAPYSAKNFLGRPKINAPANTTQFLFEDKELGLNILFDSDNECSEPSLSLNTSSEGSNQQNEESTESMGTPIYDGFSMNEDVDRFHEEQFDRMYNDVRAEMLRQQPVDVLSTRCMELETAIHNMEFLIHKETDRKHQIEEMVYLTRRNAELEAENQFLRQAEEKTKVDTDFVQEPSVSTTC
uniref:Protein HEXIM n=1 Tax=Phallusia mammillata TaxID=59560 RepID=A0A6F9DF78_9ASCI|nr:protein HEXIM [Phallusia mammillata]